MGRRRRRVIRIVKKKLPTVFVCPRCGEEAVRVSIDKATGKAKVLCAICQLKDEFDAHPRAQAIDVYSYFTDRFYGVKDPRAIIPHERRTIESPAEEAEPEVAEPSGELDAPQPSLEDPGTEPAEPFTQPESASAESPMNDTSSEPQQSTESMIEEKMDEPDEAKPAVETEKEEEEEPFGDILQSEKDKKRYSPNPVQQQEQTSE